MTDITTRTAATLTLERFASLRPAWQETIVHEGGVLLARIHPRNNRPHGDEEVLARALVFVPPYCCGTDEGHLARLTIRTINLTGPFPAEWSYLLKTVLSLPVIELEES